MYLFFNIDISIDLFSTSFQRSELSCFKVRVKNAINHLYIGAVKQKSNLTFVNCHIKSIARFFEIILILIKVNQPLHFIDTVSLHWLWKELFDWSILPRTSLFKELFLKHSDFRCSCSSFILGLAWLHCYGKGHSELKFDSINEFYTFGPEAYFHQSNLLSC